MMKKWGLLVALMVSVNFVTAQVLDTITFPLDRASQPSLFGIQGGGGFISGTNSFDVQGQTIGTFQVGNHYDFDKGKILGAYVWFGSKEEIGQPDSYEARVYDAGSDSLPTGQPLDQVSFTTTDVDTPSQIQTLNDLNYFDFPNNPQQNGRFVVSIEVDGPNQNDTLGVLSNDDGDGQGEERSVQQLSAQGGLWLKMADIWGTQTNPLDVDLMILPVVERQFFANVTADKSQVCPGGSVNLNADVTGGSGNFYYQWSPGGSSPNSPSTTVSIGNQPINTTKTFDFLVIDINNQDTITKSITIDVAGINVTTNPGDTTIPCGSTIDLAASLSGDTQGASISWSDGTSGAFNNNVSPGTYTVSVTNNAGCVDAQSITINCNGGGGGNAQSCFTVNQNSPQGLYPQANNVSCFTRGQYEERFIDFKNFDSIAALGTTVAVNYVIIDSINNLPCGLQWTTNKAISPTPHKFFQDELGCIEITGTVAPNQSAGQYKLEIIMTVDVDLLPGGPDTTVSARAIGLNNTPYILRVKGTPGAPCPAVDPTIPSEIGCNNGPGGGGGGCSSFSVTAQATTGCGSATASASGGTSPYNYQWSNGDFGPSISGVSNGVYTVTASDANGCTATDNVSVTTGGNISISTNSQPASCGSSDGSATASASGGTSPYDYQWSNGDFGQSITGLTAGTYTVTVSDLNGCTATATVSVTATGGNINVSTNSQPASCGSSDGSATASASGGSLPYNYQWSTGDFGQSISGVSAGTYSVTVIDANNCQSTATVTVESLGNAPSVSIQKSDVSCYGENDGSAFASVGGGLSPYSFSWSNGATGQSVNGLSAGSYTVTVTGSNNCQAVASVLIDEPPAISININTTSVTCEGGTDGSVSATVSGGNSPYDYFWSTGDKTQSVNNLSSGTYRVTVSDAQGCSMTASTFLSAQNGFSITTNTSEASCGGSNGSASVQAQPGGNFSYQWDNGQTTSAATGLSAGVYTVTVTEITTGCEKTETLTVSELGAPSVSVNNISDVTCNGGGDGEISLDVFGGNTPYNYNWSNTQQTGKNVSGLSAGNYTVTVSGSNGCSSVEQISIDEPRAIIIDTLSVTSATIGKSNGSIDIAVTGGLPPYNYNWSNNESTEDISELQAGTYTVTVTDGNGCKETMDVKVNQEVGVDKLINDTEFTVYPNPTSGKIHIELALQQSADFSVAIYNALGQKTFEENHTDKKLYNKSMNIGESTSGLRFVKVTIDGHSIVRKIIVNR